MNHKILDCTLRDGGYYNKWDFEHEVIKSYLAAMSEAKVDIVELGLRNFPKNQFLGAHAYTTEEYLTTVQLPEGPLYGVMVDAATILQSSTYDTEEAINQLFVDAENSKISLVRVAAHFKELPLCEGVCSILKKMGYIVGLNMMQAGGKPSDLISKMSTMVESWGCVDVLYFADSIGSMDHVEISRVIKAIQFSWRGDLGIHTHDNMNRAISNTIHANSLGVSWLDATVCGMGRGAGNSQTEYLLPLMRDTKYSPEPVYSLVVEHFQDMKAAHGWGSNLLYFLGAQNNIHPTFIQTLISSPKYSKDDFMQTLHYLSKNNYAFTYSNELLDEAIDFGKTVRAVSGGNKLVGAFKGLEVLIIAAGQSVKRYHKAIEQYINKFKPVVFSVNIVESVNAELIDYYLITHNSKFISQFASYSKIRKNIILPKHRFTEEELSTFSGGDNIIDYGFDVLSNKFEVTDSYCKSPLDLTFSYAFGCAVVSGCGCIKLVGFDGYSNTDPRQAEMIQLLKFLKDGYSIPMEALTPTTYPLKQGSVYALNL